MKKVLTILVVLTVIAGFAFADAVNINTVKLSTTVAGIEPVFAIKHDNTNETIKTVGSIAEGNVVAAFEINQVNPIVNNSLVGYSNYGISAGTAVSLTVTCAEFTDGVTTSANVPVISGAEYGAVVEGKLTYGTDPVNGSSSAIFVPTYHGKRVDNQLIGSFTATWAQDNTLPAGTYTADITLAYTAN